MFSISVALLIVGLATGSFVNALVWRLREQTRPTPRKKKTDLSILNGRSVCPDCRHKLAWYDLIPIISWLSLGGKCRYCKKPISYQYPLVELISGLIFLFSYIFWPTSVHLNGQWILLAGWLTVSIGLLALAVYDLRWFLLPNRIIYPTVVVAAVARAAFIIFYEPRPWHALLLWGASLAIASGVFFVLFYLSKGQWIGYGDVRLGLITGTVLGTPQKSLSMLFLASLLGTLVVLPSLARRERSLASRLPFGPFLIAATAILVLFGDSLINWYTNLIT